MEEIFLDIKGWEGKHQISNYGRIKTFNYGKTDKTVIRNGILKDEYLIIQFKDKKTKRVENHRVNRLEAITFNLPIPEHLKDIPIEKLDVEHIDANPLNNKLDNLRWTDRSGNMNNKITRQRIKKSNTNNTKLSNIIIQLDKDTNDIIAEFPSAREVERQYGYNIASLSLCCNGKRKTAYGYKWVFKK